MKEDGSDDDKSSNREFGSEADKNEAASSL